MNLRVEVINSDDPPILVNKLCPHSRADEPGPTGDEDDIFHK
jgi:hypothetical protein